MPRVAEAHWFNPLAEFVGPASLRNAFTDGPCRVTVPPIGHYPCMATSEGGRISVPINLVAPGATRRAGDDVAVHRAVTTQ